jgi:hypothetical protein
VAVILKEPSPKKVPCDACGAIIGYLPEEVQYSHDMDMGPEAYVKCPRKKCPGVGYPSRNKSKHNRFWDVD